VKGICTWGTPFIQNTFFTEKQEEGEAPGSPYFLTKKWYMHTKPLQIPAEMAENGCREAVLTSVHYFFVSVLLSIGFFYKNDKKMLT
jgi:hypothetical protein